MNISQFINILEKITKESSNVIIPEDLNESTKITELSLDSLHIFELSMEIEGLLQRIVETDIFYEDISIGELLLKI